MQYHPISISLGSPDYPNCFMFTSDGTEWPVLCWCAVKNLLSLSPIPKRYRQMDGRTDRIAISISHVSVLKRDKSCKQNSLSEHTAFNIFKLTWAVSGRKLESNETQNVIESQQPSNGKSRRYKDMLWEFQSCARYHWYFKNSIPIVNAYDKEAGIGVIAGNTVWFMPERLECEVLQKNAI